MPWVRFEEAAYWILFSGTFLAIAVWESFRPRATLNWPTQYRWGRHAMILAISAMAQTALFRVTPVVVAASVSGSRFGILNRAWMPFPVRCAAAILLLDLARYGLHRAFHAVAFLWRVHAVHHSDPDYDVSTAGRFHPIEVVVMQGAYLALVAVLAPPVAAVLASELLAVVLNFFAHANAAVPRRVERILRLAFITPDIHRVHHSERIEEQSRNFGQTFSWWDRLFGTFQSGNEDSKEVATTGITGLRNSTSLNLGFMLAEPFRHKTPNQPAGPIRVR